ncbi:MAG: hypothetical protein HYV09_05770 [Deltaproteobacteria bacterium]|nr:hypothetical protein [Deltaproteobacteria bacterium]
MQLPPRKAPAHGLDRVRLTEHVAERHARVLDVPWRRRKRALAAALFAASLGASLGMSLGASLGGCGGEPKVVATAPPTIAAPEPTASAKPLVVTGPVEESRRMLAEALAATDRHERCRLLNAAALLDPSSFEAQKARAESRCAPAAELLGSARAAFGLRRDASGASLLSTVALRAGARADAVAAGEALAAMDTPDKLAAARLFAKLGEHARAAKLFGEVAAARASKGAALDALDARLDAIIEGARAAEPVAAALEATLTEASTHAKGYGDAWVGPKVVEAIAAVRNAGQKADALAKKARAMFGGDAAKEAFEIERAIAAARDGKPNEANALAAKLRSKIASAPVRALLAVRARTSGSCSEAKAHARAHGWLPAEGLRLDDDVSWASTCEGGKVPATVIAPVPSDEIADLRAVAEADPLRASARLDVIVKERPDDVSAWLAAIDLAPAYARASVAARAGAALPDEPWIRLAELSATGGAAVAQALAAKVLPATVEASIPRAIAPLAARAMLLEKPLEKEPAWDDVAERLVTSCAAALPTACLDAERAPALGRATARLRKSRTKVLATKGVALSPADLAVPRVRLDVVVALAATGDKKAAIFAAPLGGAEAAVARVAIAAANGKCDADARKSASALAGDYADVLDTACK